MNFRDYLGQHLKGTRQHICEVVGIKVAYSYQLSGGHRSPSLKLARAIAAATKNKVSVNDWPVPKNDVQ
jgi:hypothetical protein